MFDGMIGWRNGLGLLDGAFDFAQLRFGLVCFGLVEGFIDGLD